MVPFLYPWPTVSPVEGRREELTCVLHVLRAWGAGDKALSKTGAVPLAELVIPWGQKALDEGSEELHTVVL